MTKTFSLTLTCLENNDCIVFEKSSLICQYRETILEYASKIGANIRDQFNIEVSSYENYSNLLFFITSLEREIFAVSVNGKEIEFFKKVPFMIEGWNSIIHHSYKMGATPTLEGGFDFKDVTNANDFIEYMHSIELLDQYRFN